MRFRPPSLLRRIGTGLATENAGTPASAAVDGNTGTCWSSAVRDPQSPQVDLGGAATVYQVVLTWETAHASAFQIQVSPDAATWTTPVNQGNFAAYANSVGVHGFPYDDVANQSSSISHGDPQYLLVAVGW